MKFKQLLLGSLFVGLVASCSDDLNYDDNKVLENETTTYVRVSILGDNITRADEDFELGNPDESMIKSILLMFYDAGRNYVGQKSILLNESNEITDIDDYDHTVERIKTFIAQIELPQNINYPKYVVAYVNPTSKALNDLATEKLEDAMKFIRARNEVSYNGYRTMNNAMYFDGNTGYTRFATEIDFKGQFFKTEAEAKAENANSIDIYVERMEAKIRTSIEGLKNDKITPFDSESGITDDEGNAIAYTLTFVPEAWFVNGTEKRSFLLKNYRFGRKNFLTGNMTDTDYGFSLNALNSAFRQNDQDNRRPDSFTVNDEDNTRSFWAIDPTYFYEDQTESLYPDVSYDVKYGTINPTGAEYPLLYRSYNNVLAEKTSNNYVKFDGNVKTHEYVLENTLSLNTLRSTDAKAAMTSVVLLGHYLVKNAAGEIVFNGASGETGPKTANAFYIRHEANGKKYVMITDEQAIDFFMERSGSTFFVMKLNQDGTPAKDEAGHAIYEPLRAAHLKSGNNYPVSYQDFKLEYPTKELAGKKQSEQWRTLRVATDANGKYNNNLYVYDNNGGYKLLNELSSEELTTFLSRMYSSFGVLERFQAGKAYFNVPLKHIWAPSNNSNEFKPDNVLLGDYGVVRNHIYDLTINKITGLGTGIGDINQPIVPPTENEQYYISTRLNILKWRVVNQSVDL